MAATGGSGGCAGGDWVGDDVAERSCKDWALVLDVNETNDSDGDGDGDGSGAAATDAGDSMTDTAGGRWEAGGASSEAADGRGSDDASKTLEASASRACDEDGHTMALAAVGDSIMTGAGTGTDT